MSFRYISTFLVGFAVGAGLALLYAPMPGKKMQKKVTDITDDFKNAVRKVV
jgi:gas vesicle protein